MGKFRVTSFAINNHRVSDLEDTVMKALMEFVYQLLCAGDLTMARVLRVIILEKYNNKQMCSIANTSLSSQQIYTRYVDIVL